MCGPIGDDLVIIYRNAIIERRRWENTVWRWSESPSWKRQGEQPTLTTGKEIAPSALKSQNIDSERLEEFEFQDRDKSKHFQLFLAFQDYGIFFPPSPGSKGFCLPLAMWFQSRSNYGVKWPISAHLSWDIKIKKGRTEHFSVGATPRNLVLLSAVEWSIAL